MRTILAILGLFLVAACSGQGARNLDGSLAAGPLASDDCTINPAFCASVRKGK